MSPACGQCGETSRSDWAGVAEDVKCVVPGPWCWEGDDATEYPEGRGC